MVLDLTKSRPVSARNRSIWAWAFSQSWMGTSIMFEMRQTAVSGQCRNRVKRDPLCCKSWKGAGASSGDMRIRKGWPKYRGMCWKALLLSESTIRKKGFRVKGYKSPGYRQCTSFIWRFRILWWSDSLIRLFVITPPKSYPSIIPDSF